MEINFIVIGIATILQIIIGALWFGVIFQKPWMKLNRVDRLSKEEIEKSQKENAFAYPLSFLINLVQTFVLALIIKYTPDFSGVLLGLCLWLGFNLPAQATVYLWDSHKTKFEKMNLFLIATSYQLVIFMMSGYLLSNFG